MSRYATPRRHLSWNKNNRLRVLKMLAWVTSTIDGATSPVALERRVEALCEPVMQIVLGEPGVTLAIIRQQTLVEQGIAITATRLHQRADKTHRYDELNEFASAVIDAYKVVVAQTISTHPDEILNARV